MDFENFVEGPLLWIVFLVLFSAIIARWVFFSFRIIHDADTAQPGRSSKAAMFGRFFFPFHKALVKRPLYALVRYVFHLCLFVVPIWLGGHVALWAESRFEWDWSSLPDPWADWMTMAVMVIAVFFIIRRIAWPRVRPGSSVSDYLIILIAALPFFTGYSLAHGTLDGLPFVGGHMMLIHVLSGQAMMIMAAFLFTRTRLNPSTCTGCASCELSCPTGTLESKDQGRFRIFSYSHYQCICCGACVNVCPESAAELRHKISLGRFFQVGAKQEIRSVELKPCQKCGALFVPEPLFHKINRAFADEYLLFCPNCRKTNLVDLYRRLSPQPMKESSSLPKPLSGDAREASSRRTLHL
jgi:Pyruvate/2-oxoacid:ferredoxin oxidoreductase delta subunit